MDWARGYTSEYYMTVVDPATWRDISRIEITGGSIRRETDGLMQSASVDCINYPSGTEKWIRIWLDTEQAGENGHEPLFTGIATSPEQNWDGNMHEDPIECYSVLKPADDVDLLPGWYAPAGMSGGAVIRSLLSKTTPAPVIVAEDSPTLSSHIIAEGNETHLTMVQKILTAIGWRLRITGNGVISVEPYSDEPVIVFDPAGNDMIETRIDTANDWYGCPNVFMAIQDDVTAIAKDETGDSILSVGNRGREVWMQESGCNTADNESLEQYSMRRLKEEQQMQQTASYGRRYHPDVLPGDAIMMRYQEQGVAGIYHVNSQSIALSHEARTDEEIAA